MEILERFSANFDRIRKPRERNHWCFYLCWSSWPRACCYGLFRLFAIHALRSGDVYPALLHAYRTDGLGAKALHDSLAELMHVERNLRPGTSSLSARFNLPERRHTPLFMLGVSNLSLKTILDATDG